MLTQLRNDRPHVNAHRSQFLLRNFDEYFFILNAEKLDLGNVFHAQDFLPNFVRKFLHLRRCKAVCLQGINDAIHIAKIIDKERAHHTRWQSASHVADFFAHCVPNIGHLGRLGIVFDLENNLRFTRFGITADLVCKRHFLKRSLQFVSDLLCYLLGCSTRPIGPDDHHAKREGRVFVLA